ncbi:MAG: V-type ATP synthase subunit D [Clostridiales bacterium]|jgi:V/A-type H+-transporting ATPase subunit D|nr:V-type ATP synthase subunit D [Clostridiales bacterium]
MARLNVNPNRMELNRLKARLTTAKRGHKLLKDKQDELMRRFIEFVKENNRLRRAVEAELLSAYQDFLLAAAVTSPEFLEEAVFFPKESVTLEVTPKNIMSVIVPNMKFTMGLEDGDADIYPYGFFTTSGELDRALVKLFGLLPKLLNLAEVEKKCDLMTDEIEKTRRRVNALEYMTIPSLEETIRYINMKLSENERGNMTRLMKVKSMIADR